MEVIFEPDKIKVNVRPGTTLLHAAHVGKVPVRSRCGGKASCLMCKVLVDEQTGLSVPSMNEQQKLNELLKKQYRLACQAKVTGTVTVTVPEDPLKSAIRAQLAKQQNDELW